MRGDEKTLDRASPDAKWSVAMFDGEFLSSCVIVLIGSVDLLERICDRVRPLVVLSSQAERLHL